MRNVANLVPPYEPQGKFHGTSAALEFAVQELRVPNVIVLGHSHCGGIDAYRTKPRPKSFDYSFVGNWLTLLDDLKLVESDRFTYGEETAFELAGVRSSLAKLRTFPFIERPLADGLLQLHGLHFDLGSGMLLMLDDETGKFVDLRED